MFEIIKRFFSFKTKEIVPKEPQFRLYGFCECGQHVFEAKDENNKQCFKSTIYKYCPKCGADLSSKYCCAIVVAKKISKYNYVFSDNFTQQIENKKQHKLDLKNGLPAAKLKQSIMDAMRCSPDYDYDIITNYIDKEKDRIKAEFKEKINK